MNVHFSSKTDGWETPKKFFDKLNREFRFTLDPCATKENRKCKKYFTEKDDGLSKSWDKEIVFMNPPYGRVIGKWVKKASEIRGGVCRLLIAGAYRYTMVSRVYLQKGRNSFYKGSIKIWGQQKLCSISQYGCHI